jgi:succinate-acetate transporter protein
VRAPSQRRALGALFAFLAVLFSVIAIAAIDARIWVVAIAAGALALWLLSTAARSFR